MRKKTNSVECDETKKEKAKEIVEEYDCGKSYELNILIGLFIPCVLAILHLIIASVFGKTTASAITHPLLAIMVPLALFLILRALLSF